MLLKLNNLITGVPLRHQGFLLYLLTVSLIILKLTGEVSAKTSKPKRCKLVKRGLLTAQIPLGTSPAMFTGTGAATPTGTAGSSTPTLAPKFDYSKRKVIGVNLGGWFVLEPWITPSLFIKTNNNDIVDEYTLGQKLDRNTATSILTQHWETWITEDDFVTMSKAGLTHVRIPLGYWSIPTGENVDPYTPGAWPYFLQALKWAHAHGIYTIVDLHGAPGSQNGYDNSGQRTGNPRWALDSANVQRTINDLVFLAKNTVGLIDVLEVLNESGGFISPAWVSTTRQFFQDAYNAIRSAVGTSMDIMIGDAFQGVQSWQGFLTANTGAQGVLMDWHQYQIFDDAQLARTMDEHISFACSLIPAFQSYAANNIWTVMGEWTAAITDCANSLNSRGSGSRWDGTYSDGAPPFGTCGNMTGSSDNWSDEYKTFLRKYWEVQSVLGDSAQGNVWWTWKAENADDWDYSKGLKGGWIPQDPKERLYPNICG